MTKSKELKLDEEPLFTPSTDKKIAENGQKSKVGWNVECRMWIAEV